ncbi:unnamed protein product [Boreogadus saida]
MPSILMTERAFTTLPGEQRRRRDHSVSILFCESRAFITAESSCNPKYIKLSTTNTGPTHRCSCPTAGQAKPGAEGEKGGPCSGAGT